MLLTTINLLQTFKMGLEGGLRMIKYLVFLANFLFWLSGLGLIVVGVMAHLKYSVFSVLTGQTIGYLIYAIILIGAIIFVVAFYGCCGAVRENNCMITTFTVLLIFIFVAELGAGIAAYIYKQEVTDIIYETTKNAINSYPDEGEKGVDFIQQNFNCCGGHEFKEWFSSQAWLSKSPRNNDNVPESCCKDIAEGCGHNIFQKKKQNDIHTMGCIPKVVSLVKGNLMLMGSVLGGIILVELLATIFACCLMRGIRDLDDEF
uniref:Tetraspanin n=2 Tax=Eptatretus burgeri TaxID=7764 RepID=A0A8C4QGU0_EPTBU